MTVVQRTGNKKVTLVDNLDLYGIPPEQLARTVQRIAATSTSGTTYVCMCMCIYICICGRIFSLETADHHEQGRELVNLPCTRILTQCKVLMSALNGVLGCSGQQNAVVEFYQCCIPRHRRDACRKNGRKS